MEGIEYTEKISDELLMNLEKNLKEEVEKNQAKAKSDLERKKVLLLNYNGKIKAKEEEMERIKEEF